MRRAPVTAALALALLALPGSAAAQDCPGATAEPTPDTAAAVKDAIVCLINVERSAAGRGALSQEPELGVSATGHSDDMIRGRYLAHEREGHPTLLQRVTAAGYFRGVIGALYSENVGAAPQGAASPETVVRAWLGSPTHRANILYPGFSEIGIGIAFAPPDPAFYRDYASVLFTTDFGDRTLPRAGAKRRCRHVRRVYAEASARRKCRRRISRPGGAR